MTEHLEYGSNSKVSGTAVAKAAQSKTLMNKEGSPTSGLYQSEPSVDQLLPASPSDSTSTVLALIEKIALDPCVGLEKLERMMTMYERLKAKEAELAYNAAKGRILKKLADIKIDADAVEAVALEKSGPRMFANMESKNAVAVIDREKRTVIATWSIAQEAKDNVAMAFDETGHRLFVTTEKPGKLIVLDSDSGKVVTSLPCVTMNDDMAYDPGTKRIYIAGSGFVDVFRQRDADHYELIGHVPGAFRAQTAVLVPETNRYYLAVPHHGTDEAAVQVYAVQP